MSADERLIAALEAGLAGAPGDPAITAHLAGLLLADGRAGEALERCRVALALAPADPALLAPAAEAAKATGDPSAAGYRSLLSALGGAVKPEPEPEPEPTPEPEPARTVVPLRAIDGGRPDDDDENGAVTFERPARGW